MLQRFEQPVIDALVAVFSGLDCAPLGFLY
jgi:hypothetical protein